MATEKQSLRIAQDNKMSSVYLPKTQGILSSLAQAWAFLSNEQVDLELLRK